MLARAQPRAQPRRLQGSSLTSLTMRGSARTPYRQRTHLIRSASWESATALAAQRVPPVGVLHAAASSRWVSRGEPPISSSQAASLCPSRAAAQTRAATSRSTSATSCGQCASVRAYVCGCGCGELEVGWGGGGWGWGAGGDRWATATAVASVEGDRGPRQPCRHTAGPRTAPQAGALRCGHGRGCSGAPQRSTAQRDRQRTLGSMSASCSSRWACCAAGAKLAAPSHRSSKHSSSPREDMSAKHSPRVSTPSCRSPAAAGACTPSDAGPTHVVRS